MQWLRGKVNVGYDIEGQGSGPRKEIWGIPEVAFKEAIINSLSHRDYYEKGAVTTVEVFTDRVEITNPGGLVSGILAKDFGYKSLSRNPLIFGLFSRMHLVEQIGSGIMRMNDLMRSAGLPAPEFRTEGMFTVIFRRPSQTVEETVEETLEKNTRKLIISSIRANPKVTIQEMRKVTGLTRRGVEYQISQMKQEGQLQRMGSTKAGYWQLSD